MEQHGMPDYQRRQQQAAVVIDDGARQLFLNAGRVLIMWGGGALVAASAAGRKNDDDGKPDTCSAVHALLAFVVWLLGVSLVALVHVERRRLPRAAANAVIDCFLSARGTSCVASRVRGRR